MSASGIIGTYQGVRSPGTAYVLLHHYMGEIDGAFRAWGIPKGGTGGVSRRDRARGPGPGRGDPDRGAGGPDHGPRRPGDRRRAGERRGDRGTSVLSSADAKVTFLDLLEPGTLDPEFEAGRPPVQVPRLARARSTWPSTGCRTSPASRAPASTSAARSSFSPSIDDMEQAYDDAKYGRWSRKPYIDMIIPTLVDPRWRRRAST